MQVLHVLIAVTSLSDVSRWTRSNGLEIVLLITGAALLTRFATWLGQRITARIDAQAEDDDALVRSEATKHRHALTQVIAWTALVLIYFVTGVAVVQRLGVPLTSLVAPATVVGVALGFGAQRVVQDLLAGIFIITERQYGYGDVVRISALGATTGITGTIEDVSLRITRLRTPDGEVVIVPNGQIQQVTNLSRDWARAVVDVPVPSAIDINRATDILRAVGDATFSDEDLRPLMLDAPSVMGVESIGVDEFKIQVVARTLPGKQFDVGRELRSRITVAVREAGIAIPAGPDAAAATKGA
ncbi:MAG: mechanosensitive ion channel family protein [Actinomycetota bacterium]|nr:mechanosensitive ion channel family protein [Actinomycetota bacterium]